MIANYFCFVFILLLTIQFTLQSRVPWPISNNKNLQPTTTEAPRKVHLTMHETSYSTEEKVKYINECVEKCMQNHRQKTKRDLFDTGRDNCIQLQCRIYE